MELWQFLGNLHPKLVQLPLVLLPAGLLFDLAGVVRPRADWLHRAGKVLCVAGTVALLFAFICGIYAEIWAGRAGVPQQAIEWHELVANVASWGFVLLAAWRLLLDPDRHRGAIALYAVAGLGYYLLLALTAHLGGSLVFEYGAAVTGASANTVPSLHDLNTLATRQTDENLRYSEMMHHIFGFLTLGLAGSLLVQAMLPGRAARLRWVGPLLLLLGGVFLFFFADLDLYRLADPRQFRDREVQLHKTIAVLLAVVGAAGLRASRRARAVAGLSSVTRRPHLGATGADTAGLSRQSKLVAIMALVGGGLLFTHVHTVAPYANVAAGVYVAHVVLGIVALAIGAARLLQDAVPRARRGFAALFAVLMLVESVLLITYNEGLPWYIGYGRYNRWGARGGTVAPYGPVRAELTFDPATGRADVYVLDRFSDAPAPVPAREVNLLVARGYEEVAIPLRAGTTEGGSDGDGAGASYFTGLAPALKDVPAFAARLSLPIGRSGRERMGYFDPWVTPLVAPVPPNEVAAFQCPMHEGFRAAAGGACRLCGMPLVPIDATPRTALHDAEFDMRLDASANANAAADAAEGPDAGASRVLTFTPLRNGQPLRDLAIVHEKPLHLIIVSADLSFFDHVHPTPRVDGTLELAYTFPAAGPYVLFADITPQGGRSQVFRFPLTVGTPDGHEASPPVRLMPSPAAARAVAGDPSVIARLMPQPRTLLPGIHSHLLLRLSREGRPLSDLEPYLGAMGHCVVISEDTQTYLHCHPEQLLSPAPDARGGPDVAFHTRFPKPGRYKLWAQFQRAGQVIIADFVVEVPAAPVPAKWVGFLLDD